MKIKTLAIAVAICVAACDSNKPGKNEIPASSDDVTSEWKLGVALWTFHTVDFPESLKMVDSVGVEYIEPNTFHKAGKELNDTLLGELSPYGIDKLKQLVKQHNLKVGSIYLGGGKTINDWKKNFDIAKQFDVKYVTAEPPVDMWDSIDSLAGVYGIKVAIHEHWKGVSAYWHPDSVLAAIKGHQNFGACADLGHWPKSGIDPVEGIKKLAGHIFTIHLKDIAEANNPKLEDVPVGTGIVDFPKVFEELKKQKFNGFIYIERDAQDAPSNVKSVIQTVKYYKEQVAKIK
jgi:sugar phosphate isomerase/epimerase